MQVLLTGFWDLEDVLSLHQNRSKNKLVFTWKLLTPCYRLLKKAPYYYFLLCDQNVIHRLDTCSVAHLLNRGISANSWFTTVRQGRHVGGQYNRIFSRRIYLKMEFSSEKREMLLFFITNMADVTSRSNRQYPQDTQIVISFHVIYLTGYWFLFDLSGYRHHMYSVLQYMWKQDKYKDTLRTLADEVHFSLYHAAHFCGSEFNPKVSHVHPTLLWPRSPYPYIFRISCFLPFSLPYTCKHRFIYQKRRFSKTIPRVDIF